MAYRCWTKATRREAGPPRHSASWLLARRTWLEFHPDRVTCGDWAVPFASVESATLYKTRQLFVPVSVLELATGDGVFQFGLNPWVNVILHLPIKLTVKHARLRYSLFSVMALVAFFASLLWLAWTYLS